MKDIWNKVIKIVAITAICIAALVALCVLSMFAYIGGNAFFGTSELQKDAPTVIIAGNVVENTFSSLGYAFLTLLVNLSMVVLFGFIVGVWIVTVFWILQEDIEFCWLRLKEMFKNFLLGLFK